MDIIIIVIAFVAPALAVLGWGANNTDGINGTEWERRQRWFDGFHYQENA